MLHAKFQDHRPFSSGEEDFKRFLLYMGVAAILVMRPEPFSPFPRRLHIKCGFDWSSGFRGEYV